MTQSRERWIQCAELFYQNREQEAYQTIGELLPEINQYIQNIAGTQTAEAAKAIVHVQQFLEAYQKYDQLAIADWLCEEAAGAQSLPDRLSEDTGEVLRKNEAALQQKWKDQYENYKNLYIQDSQRCSLKQAGDQMPVLQVVSQDHIYRLNSMNDTKAASECYARRYGKIQDYAGICIYGLADGRIVRELLKNCNGTQEILIYEPDAEVFAQAMHHCRLDDIIREEKVRLVVDGINGWSLGKNMEEIITYQNKDLLVQCILPNYDVVYSEKCRIYVDEMIRFMKKEVFNKNTELLRGAQIADNLMQNLPALLEGASVEGMQTYFGEHLDTEVPAIIVSAGPSLDKNIRMLKRAKGHAFLIGVDSALKALLREEIRPDIAISIDPGKNPELFTDDRLNELPFVVAGFSLPMIVRKNRSRVFFVEGYGSEIFGRTIEEQTGTKLGKLETGGSVATDAFSLAVRLGFKRIILVGQDLAFTGGQTHVSGFAECEANEREDDSLTEVEGMDGTMLRTDIQMAYYKEWFERRIRMLQGEVEVINATEGGARIYGTREMTLADAIAQWCTKTVDFKQWLMKIPCTFSNAQQRRLKEIFLQTEQELLSLEEMLREGVAAYELLIGKSEQEIAGSPECRQALEMAERVNHLEETESTLILVKMYALEEEYQATEDIYSAKELSISDIARRGKDLLEGYLKGLQMCKERVHTLLLPGLEKMQCG